MTKITTNKKINRLNNDAKKSMKQRIVSSVIMGLFFIILFLFAILSDNVNSWAVLKNNLIGKQVTGFLLLFMFIPIVFVIGKEINNIYFQKKVSTYITISFLILSTVYIPTLIYFLRLYELIKIDYIVYPNNPISRLNLTNIFAIALSLNIFVILVSNIIVLKLNNQLTFKNYLILTSLIGLSSGFFLGLFYFNFVQGWTTLLFLFLITIMMDSFAYFGGVMFGKHKMAPVISPKKTWEGLIIAIALTLIMSVVIIVIYAFADSNGTTLNNIIGVQYHKQVFNNISSRKMYQWWLAAITLIIVLSIISVFGDLSFSIFKRQYKIKDYGSLIPGHGGILDRIDSHCFVLGAYLLITMFMHLFAKTPMFV